MTKRIFPALRCLCICMCLLYAPYFHKTAGAQIITTIAGTGLAGHSGDGSAATAAMVNWVGGLAVDTAGNLYFAENIGNTIRKISTSGIITTIAGTGVAGYSGDGGLATAAKLNDPNSVTIDRSGNIFIADRSNQVIRKINTSGIISTYAGTGVAGYSGDGGPATAARFFKPSYIAFDTAGNGFIVDEFNHVIRKVTPAGIVSHFAGSTAGFSGDGGPATSAQFNIPFCIVIDTLGNKYISDHANARIRKIDTAGIITTIAGDGTFGSIGDGGPATAARINHAYAITLGQLGSIYVADGDNFRIREISPSGIISTVAGTGSVGYSGDGGPATAADIDVPVGIVMDTAGRLYFGVNSHHIRKVSGLEIPLAVTRAQAGADLIVFPNPCNRLLTIDGTIGTDNEVLVKVINISGQVVHAGQVKKKAGKICHDLHLDEALPAGTYLLNITCGNDGKVIPLPIGQ